MSEYRLDITGMIGLSDYSNIHDYMGVIGSEDQLVITIGPGDVDNAQIVTDMLQRNNFEISTKGGHDDGRFYISAYRRK
ncbi:hypothetical protein [Clostridium omnivorum]|uniref:Uncharacterized protein n=1 Tax=Clostridium omnivorum TaxID=1604902 RepID=A0ABQ5N3W5_9CLOT|nr:hypothetical protein [Clostridium sp. E14]GLC29928.1 hypothetical protein bsdE14_13380 [Clostridium sp. E14]